LNVLDITVEKIPLRLRVILIGRILHSHFDKSSLELSVDI